MRKQPLMALSEAFVHTDVALKTAKEVRAMSSGTTVAAVYSAGQTVYVANVGDTRVVVARQTQLDENLNSIDELGMGISELPESASSTLIGTFGDTQGDSTGDMTTSHSTRIVNTVPSNVSVMEKCRRCFPIMLTVDHKPDDPEEMARITSSKGYVSVPVQASYNHASVGPSSIDVDGNTIDGMLLDRFSDSIQSDAAKKMTVGSVPSARVWLDSKHTLVGLAMSRSIGDFAAKTVGVTATPSTVKYNVNPSDRFMIIASDGVWEFIDNQEAVDLVQKNLHLGAFTACQVLIQAAEKLWRQHEGGYRDDVSCVYAAYECTICCTNTAFHSLYR